jgi:hypothetical protein
MSTNIFKSTLRKPTGSLSMLRFVVSMSFLLLTLSTSIFGQSTVTSGSQTTITYTTSGSYTFTVPARVSSVTIKAWGGGGGGQAVSTDIDKAGGGGGGGAYTYYTLSGLTAGATYTVRVGTGGSQGVKGDSSTFESLSSGIIVKAVGGNANTVIVEDKALSSNAGGTGGQASLCIPSNVGVSGGNGGTGGPGGRDKKGGGGGGSSAGTSGIGNNGTSVTNSDNGGAGGSGDANSGSGGNGGNSGLSGSNGSRPGGGGGGEGAKAGTATPTGGTGGNGQVIITYTTPTAINAFRSLVSASWNTTSSWQQKFDDGQWYNATTYPSSTYGSLISTTSGYPVLESVDSSDQSKNAAKTHTINLPAGTSVGDLILILWADHAGSGTANVKPAYSGWTKLDFGKFHTDHNALGFYKVITSPIESQIEILSGDDDESGHIIYRFEAGTFEGAPFFSTTYVAGTINDTKFPNPPKLSSSPLAVQKVTWIAAGFSHPKSLVKIPTGFTNAARKQAVAANGMVVAAMLNKEDDELDPGEFEISAAEEWVAATIGIKGKALTTYSTERSIVTVRDGHTISITDDATGDTVNVESGGLLKFDLPNSSGKSTLSLDISSGSPMTVTGTIEIPNGSYVSGAGSFTLRSGASFKVGSSEGLTTSGATGNVRVTGTRSFHSLANYYFNHNGNQNTGNAVTAASRVYIEGGGIKTLGAPIVISDSLALSNGYPYTTTTNLITIANGAKASIGSDDSYVMGPIQKIGTNGNANYSFIYPVGHPISFNNTDKTKTNNSFSPVKIKYPVASTNITFTVTHFHANPTTHTPKMDATVRSMKNRVFEQEFWDVHNDNPGTLAGSSILAAHGVDVSLYFNNLDGNSKSATKYYLVHAKPTTDSTYWEVPNMTTQEANKADNSFAKTMLSVSVFSQRNFSGMGAAGTDEITPVSLSNFHARLTPENKVALSWATASESVNKGFRIERQHEFGGSKFQDIGFVSSKADGGNSAQLLYYNFTDIAPKVNATSYYRLVQEDIDGKLTNSEVRMIRINGQSVSLVYPNPSNGDFLISRTADGKKMDIQVVDLSGKTIKQINGIETATHKLFIQHPGIYNIKLTYPETGEQSIQRVIVQ